MEQNIDMYTDVIACERERDRTNRRDGGGVRGGQRLGERMGEGKREIKR